jgi:hypothetical protein
LYPRNGELQWTRVGENPGKLAVWHGIEDHSRAAGWSRDRKATSPTSRDASTGADGNSGDVAMMRLGETDHTFRWERHGERSFLAVDLRFADERFSLVTVSIIDEPAAVKEFSLPSPHG